MSIEIEHKYLVKDLSYKLIASESYRIIQGYLSKDSVRTVRIRVKDDRGFLTVKGQTINDCRTEFEYPIPVEDAYRMLEMCIQPLVKKTRSIVMYDGYKWEIDEFESPAKMIIAEIELDHSHHDYSIPDFIGDEVTGNPQYYNSNL